MKNNNVGVTLAEILIVLTIVAVLAGLAVPVYFHTVEQSRSSEAVANLNVINLGEKIYKLNNIGVYWPRPDGTTSTSLPGINKGLNIDLATQFYSLSVTSEVGGYSATATRKPGGSDRTYTIDETGKIKCTGTDC